MKNLIIYLFLCCGFLICCETETSYIDTMPQLEIIVYNSAGGLVDNAVAELYSSIEDWNSGENMLRTSQTDNNGSVLFTDLEEKVYYFYIKKGDLDNSNGISFFSEPLNKNEIKVLETIIK